MRKFQIEREEIQKRIKDITEMVTSFPEVGWNKLRERFTGLNVLPYSIDYYPNEEISVITTDMVRFKRTVMFTGEPLAILLNLNNYSRKSSSDAQWYSLENMTGKNFDYDIRRTIGSSAFSNSYLVLVHPLIWNELFPGADVWDAREKISRRIHQESVNDIQKGGFWRAKDTHIKPFLDNHSSPEIARAGGTAPEAGARYRKNLEKKFDELRETLFNLGYVIEVRNGQKVHLDRVSQANAEHEANPSAYREERVLFV